MLIIFLFALAILSMIMIPGAPPLLVDAILLAYAVATIVIYQGLEHSATLDFYSFSLAMVGLGVGCVAGIAMTERNR